MKNRIFIVLILFFLCAINIHLWGQEIYGQIQNEVGDSIPFSNVVLKNSIDSSFVAYSQANANGRYKILIKKSGTYFIECSNISYRKKTMYLTIEEGESLHLDIYLQSAPLEVEEVRIVKNIPVLVKRDTIVFDAASFLQGDEVVVEDLLKKIPGIEVSKDGIIRANGKEIEKVMVEDDDFLQKGYSLLTQTMPSSSIKKIELIQKYNENRLMKNIEQSDKVALNLKLKDDVKRKWFGNISSKYGPVNNYELETSVMNFGKKNSYFIAGSLNNIGYNPINDVSRISIVDEEDISISAGSLISLKPIFPDIDESKIFFNNAGVLTANAIFKPHKKVKVQLSATSYNDENTFSENSILTFSSPNLSFSDQIQNDIIENKLHGIVRLKVVYDISAKSQLEDLTQCNIENSDETDQSLFNKKPITIKLSTTRKYAFQKIRYTQKLGNNRVLKIEGSYIYDERPQDYACDSVLFSFLEGKYLHQNSLMSKEHKAFLAYYAHKWENKRLLELFAGSSFCNDRLFSEINNGEKDSTFTPLTDYKNNIYYKTTDIYATIHFLQPLCRNISLSAKLDGHQYYLWLSDTVRSNPVAFNPSIAFNWKINSQNKILAAYIYSHSNTAINNLYPNYTLVSYNSMKKGSDELRTLSNYSLILNYQLGDWSKTLFINTNALYLHNNSFYSFDTDITPDYSLTENIFLNGQNLLSISGNADLYLKSISSNLKLLFNFDKSDNRYMLKGQLNSFEYTRLKYGFEIRSAFTGIFNFNGGTKWAYSKSISNAQSNNFIMNTTFLDMYLTFKNLNIKLSSEYYHIDKQVTSKNNYYFIDLSARYKIKPNKLVLSINGNNLLNTKKYSNYLMNETYTINSYYKLLPRIILVGLEYSF